MNKKITQQLLNKVVKDYNTISEDFNHTRQHNWKEFKKILPHIKNNQSLIDLGCGNGRFYSFISENIQVKYLGIDNSPELLKKAERNHPKAKFQQADIQNLPFKSEEFDLAIAIASLHHLPSKELRTKAFQEIHRILKKGGLLIFTVWNLFQPKYKKYIWKSRLAHILSFGKYDARDTFIPWGKTGVKRYYYAFTERELKNLVTSQGFKIIESHRGNNLLLICQKESK